MTWFDGLPSRTLTVNGVELFVRTGGRAGGPPLLLVHGYPQTHAIWHRVAPRLADQFALVIPDLRGYGRSAKPDGGPDHAAYSKRTMAADLVALMDALGHPRFALAGHDRGGRVGHRLALDHPAQVARLCVIDISPTLTMYEATNFAFARAYYHWFHLIQPAPLPERHIGADPVADLRQKLGGLGSGLGIFDPRALADYEAAFVQPATIHATCEDYRAAAGIDLEHDRASRVAGERRAARDAAPRAVGRARRGPPDVPADRRLAGRERGRGHRPLAPRWPLPARGAPRRGHRRAARVLRRRVSRGDRPCG